MSKKQSAVSDEEIVTALLSSTTARAAAELCGLSVRELYNRIKDREFQVLYQEAKTEVLRGAVNQVNNSLAAAVSAVVDIMKDTDVNPATRLQAAQTLINNAGKLSEQLWSCEQHVDFAQSKLQYQ